MELNWIHKLTPSQKRTNRPVEVPQDAGAVSADTDEDAVGLTDEQARDLRRVTVQMNLRLHLHLCRLEKKMSWETLKITILKEENWSVGGLLKTSVCICSAKYPKHNVYQRFKMHYSLKWFTSGRVRSEKVTLPSQHVEKDILWNWNEAGLRSGCGLAKQKFLLVCVKQSFKCQKDSFKCSCYQWAFERAVWWPNFSPPVGCWKCVSRATGRWLTRPLQTVCVCACRCSTGSDNGRGRPRGWGRRGSVLPWLLTMVVVKRLL